MACKVTVASALLTAFAVMLAAEGCPHLKMNGGNPLRDAANSRRRLFVSSIERTLVLGRELSAHRFCRTCGGLLDGHRRSSRGHLDLWLA